MVGNSKKVPQSAILGVIISTLVYVMIFLSCLGIFSTYGLQDIQYPTIELGKEVAIPGGFFERFESIFFTIWIMTVFNTTSMSFGVSVLAFSSIIKKLNRQKWILILSPFIHLVALFPEDLNEVDLYSQLVSIIGVVFTIIVTPLLFMISKLKRSRQ